MSRVHVVGAAVVLLVAAASTQAQFSTGYYGGGDYRTLYGLYPDRPPQWPGYYGYPGSAFARQVFFYYPRQVVTLVPAAAPVTIDVTVPQDAELWIEGKKMNQTSSRRNFISPPLETGKQFNYEIRIRFKEDGRELIKSRSLDVFAGEHYAVDFVNPPKTPGRIEEIPVEAVTANGK